MKTPPFLMTEREKKRIVSLHTGTASVNSPSHLLEDFQPTHMDEICLECVTGAIPSEAEEMTDKILQTIDDVIAEGKLPTLDTVKDILWDLQVLQNPMLILTTAQKLYSCMQDGSCSVPS